MKLSQIQKITAKLVLKSGLHIGSGDTEMHIGGVDSPVIKNPITNLPYIPGSSIKGKMRSMLEWRSGSVQNEPLGYKESLNNDEVKRIISLFGVGGNAQLTDDQAKEIGPTRLAFWDCSLIKEWKEKIDAKNLLTTEVKSENSINRISGTAKSPRFIERVLTGAEFDFVLTYKKLEGDSDELLQTIFEGMKLLELDGLGGSTSRGYGKISFENVCIDGKDVSADFNKTQAFPNA